jgi:hypothetical protein
MSSQCSLIVNPLQKSKKRRCNNAYKLANSHAKANNPGPKENNSQSALCVFIFVDFTFRLRNIQHKRQTNNNLVNNRSITFSKRQKESSTSAVFRSKKAQKKKSQRSHLITVRSAFVFHLRRRRRNFGKCNSPRVAVINCWTPLSGGCCSSAGRWCACIGPALRRSLFSASSSIRCRPAPGCTTVRTGGACCFPNSWRRKSARISCTTKRVSGSLVRADRGPAPRNGLVGRACPRTPPTCSGVSSCRPKTRSGSPCTG